MGLWNVYVGIDTDSNSLSITRYTSVDELVAATHQIKAREFDQNHPPAEWGEFIGKYVLISWIPNLTTNGPTDVTVVTFRTYEGLYNQFLCENTRHRSTYRLLPAQRKLTFEEGDDSHTND